MQPYFTRPWLALFFSSLLLSCGGSDDDYSGIDGSGAPLTTAVSGPINGFGSVIVGGVHYETSTARFTISGKTGSEADLAVGSYITLEGKINPDGKQGIATHISFQPIVSGVITDINVSSESFMVLGQSIQINDDTSFDFAFTPRDITGLSSGQTVQISGATDASGRILATRISLLAEPQLEMAGQISKLDTQTKTFKVNMQTINYGNLADVPSLKEGDRIIIRDGRLEGQDLKPNHLEVDPGYKPLSNVENFEKSGLVTRFISITDFYIEDVPVTTNDHTQYIGIEINSVQQNVKIAVSGRFSDGRLVADKIQWQPEAQWKFAGKIIDIKDMGPNGGQILVQDTWIQLNNRTRLDSEFAIDGDRMKFAKLHIGDYVIVSGRRRDNFVAASLEREETVAPQIPKQIRGTISQLDQAGETFELEGRYEVTADSETQFWNAEQAIRPDEFYKIADNKLVEVRGILTDRKLKATNVKILNQSHSILPPAPAPTLPPMPLPNPGFPDRIPAR